MPHATRENLKKEIYFDENASDFDAEMKRYESAKLKYAEIKEKEMLEKSWQNYLKRKERLEKFFQSIKNLFKINKHQSNQKDR